MSREEIKTSTRNSTNTPLAAGEIFIGGIDDLSSFQELDINLHGLPSDAPGTLVFEFSPDGVNWDVRRSFALAGPDMPPMPLRVVLPRFQVKYINGATPLTAFRLTTLLHRTTSKSLTRFLNDVIGTLEPLQFNRTVIAGQRPDGSVVNIPLTMAGEVPVFFSGEAGAATEVTLLTRATEATLAALKAAVDFTNNTALTAIYTRLADSSQHAIIDNLPTIQQISGTVTASQGTAGVAAWLTDVVDRTGRLLGVADISDRAGRLLGIVTGPITRAEFETEIDEKLGDLGQATMASSTPVVIASNQSAIASKNATSSQLDGHSETLGTISDTAVATTVIGRLQKLVTLLAGGLPVALSTGGNLKVAVNEAIAAGNAEIGKIAQGTAAALATAWPVKMTDGINTMPAADTAGRALFTRLSDGSTFYEAVKTGQLPVALVGNRLDENVGSWLGATTPTVGQKAMAASLPIVLANDQSVVPVTDKYSGGQTLADQPGTGVALTFTFGSPVDLVWVRCDGGVGRADPFGGTPTANAGIYCDDGIPNPLTITTTVVKVFASGGTTVRVWGYRT